MERPKTFKSYGKVNYERKVEKISGHNHRDIARKFGEILDTLLERR